MMTDMNAKGTPTLAKILQGRLKDLRIRSLNPVFWPPMEMNMEDHWKVFLGKIKQIEENKLTHTHLHKFLKIVCTAFPCYQMCSIIYTLSYF